MKRTLSAILAGSIRAPDRLKAAGLVESDICQCGVRATTEHVLWHCDHHKQARQPWLRQLQEHLDKVDSQSPYRRRRLNSFMNRPSFRTCGVCNDDPSSFEHTMYKAEIDPIMNTPVNPEHFVTNPSGECLFEEIDGEQYLVCCTDGALYRGSSFKFKYGGYGVYYADNSDANYFSALYGARQSVFRCELRAVLHVLRTSVVSTIVKSDCHSVVKVCQLLA